MEVRFNERTRISGRNRSGKTTVADAITWCLFGKDSLGRSQFGIKTRVDGVEVAHLPHKVIMDVTIDGMSHTLERSYVEQWGRQNGEEYLRAHVTECMVDGEKYTVRDYQKFIGDLINEDTFKVLTTPTYFPSLGWEAQRKHLVEMAGAISASDVIATLDLSDEMKKKLEGAKAEHVGYQIKQVKKTLDELPVRMEEVTRQMSQEDFSETLDDEIADLQGRLRGLPTGGGDRLKFEYKRKSNIEVSASDKHYRLEAEREQERNRLERQIESAKTNIRQLEQKVTSHEKMLERCTALKEQQERERDDIRRKWNEVGKRKFEVSEGDLVCSLCGQPFPDDMRAEKLEEMRGRFNQMKSSDYERLTEMATDLKKAISEREKGEGEYSEVIRKSQEEINAAYGSIRKIEAVLDAPQDPIPTVEEILAGDANYQSILAEIAKMESAPDAMGEERKAIQSELSEKIAQRERRENNIKLEDRLNELVEQRSELNAQLYELESIQDAIDSYNAAYDDILESRLNDRFKMVRFRLFKRLLNGTRQPYCEAMVGGIPYGDLNRADRINAGIDIINALSEHYGVRVPIVIDNAESINKILETQQQMITLYVSEDDRLRVEES